MIMCLIHHKLSMNMLRNTFVHSCERWYWNPWMRRIVRPPLASTCLERISQAREVRMKSCCRKWCHWSGATTHMTRHASPPWGKQTSSFFPKGPAGKFRAITPPQGNLSPRNKVTTPDLSANPQEGFRSTTHPRQYILSTTDESLCYPAMPPNQ